MTIPRKLTFAALLVAATLMPGCVERTVKIDTRPTGATVILNDEEVGVSPAKVSFTWYGDYDLILRKSGYETVKTHFRLDPPWWQVPPFDLVTEVFILDTLRDDRELPPYELTARATPSIEELVERAEGMERDARTPR
jgi:hypothetical protein